MGNVPSQGHRSRLGRSCIRPAGSPSADISMLTEDRSRMNDRMLNMEGQLDFISRQIAELSSHYDEVTPSFSQTKSEAGTQTYSYRMIQDEPQTSTPMMPVSSSLYAEQLRRETDDMLRKFRPSSSRNEWPRRLPSTYKYNTFHSQLNRAPSLGTFYRPGHSSAHIQVVPGSCKPASHHQNGLGVSPPPRVAIRATGNNCSGREDHVKINTMSRRKGITSYPILTQCCKVPKQPNEAAPSEKDTEYEQKSIEEMVCEFEGQLEEHWKKQALLRGLLQMDGSVPPQSNVSVRKQKKTGQQNTQRLLCSQYSQTSVESKAQKKWKEGMDDALEEMQEKGKESIDEHHTALEEMQSPGLPPPPPPFPDSIEL